LAEVGGKKIHGGGLSQIGTHPRGGKTKIESKGKLTRRANGKKCATAQGRREKLGELFEKSEAERKVQLMRISLQNEKR